MIVVVSAIVDPWVTTLSFVVALAMRIQVLINNQMNLIAEENNRATLLSVSNQIEEIASVVSDPLIGVALDLSGFGTTYVGLGCITLVVIAFIFSIHYRKYR